MSVGQTSIVLSIRSLTSHFFVHLPFVVFQFNVLRLDEDDAFLQKAVGLGDINRAHKVVQMEPRQGLAEAY